jgi:RNA polymerase sigma-70 factor, ECF subfamily
LRSEIEAAREDRFGDLLNRQSRFVFRIAYAVLRNTSDAEDAVQETFLKLYRTGAWEDMMDERAFLARAAWRLAVSKLRKVRHEAPDVDMDMPSTEASPEQAAIETDFNARLHRMVDALPEELRQPLALSTVEEMTSREISQVMGIAEGTVRTRLMRARELLKKKLAALPVRRYEK